MIRLTNLILENNLCEYSDEEKRKMGIPSGATSRGGVWYVGDKYAGKVVGGKFVAATSQDVNKPSTTIPSKPKKTNQTINVPKKIKDKSRQTGEIWKANTWNDDVKLKTDDNKILMFHDQEQAKYFLDKSLPRPKSMDEYTPKGFVEQVKLCPQAKDIPGAKDLGNIRYMRPVIKNFFPEAYNIDQARSIKKIQTELEETTKEEILKKQPSLLKDLYEWKQDTYTSEQAKTNIEHNINEYIKQQDLRVPFTKLARGMAFAEPGIAAKFLEQIKVGESLTLPMSSYSSDGVIANNFARTVEPASKDGAEDRVSILIKITTKNSNGIQGLSVPSRIQDEPDDAYDDDEIIGESEIILPEGKFKVVGMEIGEKDEFIDISEPSDGSAWQPFKVGAKRPIYLVHLEQLENISENFNKNEKIIKKLNMIYISKPMNRVPSKLGNYIKKRKLNKKSNENLQKDI